MKKILITLITLISLNSWAITSDEVIAQVKLDSSWSNIRTIVTSNHSDMKTIVTTWLKGNAGKLDGRKNLKKDEEALVDLQRKIAGQYFLAFPSEVENLTLEQASIVISSRVYDIFTAKDPEFYSKLKAVDFKVDGKSLYPYAIVNIANAAGDLRYVAESMSPCNDSLYIDIISHYCLNHNDKEFAMKRLTSIRNYFILNNKEVPSKIKAAYNAVMADYTLNKLSK